MSWLDEVKVELQRAEAAGGGVNSGKVRTSARRAVGIALMELQRRFPEKSYGRDIISQLQDFAGDESVPEETRLAADRLQARLSPQFESPSKNPIDDAKIIIRFVMERLT
jgi:hypothetical protein